MKDEEKKEKMNELMNRISLALKDASLAQGFEIICKRISELEKENKISEEIIIGEQQEINELKKEISALLSCANCQENKGGYVCEKEYNDKCLAQKIEYIKELKEENEKQKEQLEELTRQNEKMKNVGNCKKAMLCAEWNEKQCILGQMRFCLNCKEWELAE